MAKLDLTKRRQIRALEAKRDVVSARKQADTMALKTIRTQLKSLRGSRRRGATLRAVS